MPEEIALRGGKLIDGTGTKAVRADVVITEGRITKIGRDLSGDRNIDVEGLCVVPGFIDVHTHYDAQVTWDSMLTPSCWHGVTSVIAGNCGFTIAPCREAHQSLIARTLERVEDMPLVSLESGIDWQFETFPEYLYAVAQRGTLINFGAYIGHTALRIYVMGEAAYSSPADDYQIMRMSQLVEEAVRAGAFGFSSSLAPSHVGDGGRPVPSRFASTDEIKELMRAVGRTRRGVVTIVQGRIYPGDETISFPELYDLQREIGVPLTWVALLADSQFDYREILEFHVLERSRGADVWAQTSCRPVTFQGTLASPHTFRGPAFGEIKQLSTLEQKKHLYSDPSWRSRARADLDRGDYESPKWHLITVDESAHTSYLGRTIADIAAESGVEPLDAMINVALSEALTTRFRFIVSNDDMEGLSNLLRAEGVLIALSDAGAHVAQLCDACVPTHLLGTWVRDRGALTIETAVRKLTGEPADVFGIAGRGYVKPGYAADIVVLDPDSVSPGPMRRVRDLPGGAERLVFDQPTGIEYIFVNGVPIIESGKYFEGAASLLPGELLRSGAAHVA